MRKLLLVVLDGLGDRPLAKLKGLTPLEYANTPNMDELASRGACGLHWPLEPGLPVGSGLAHLALFGYSREAYPGRGVLEALGLGIQLREGELAFRINFSYVAQDFTVLDRRIARDDFGVDEIVEDLNKELEEFGAKVYKGVGHRGVLVLSGDYSERVEDMDPQEEGKKVRFEIAKDKEAEKTEKILKKVFLKCYELMKEHRVNEVRQRMKLPPANAILIRGAGKMRKIPGFQEKWGLKAFGIAGIPLYKGCARFVGMEISEDWGELSLRSKPIEFRKRVMAAIEALKHYDFVFLHFKPPDRYGENGEPEKKAKVLEVIDWAIEPLLDLDNTVIAVTGDHSTPCERGGMHTGDAVPLLICGPGVTSDSVHKFGERACAQGLLGRLRAKDVLRVMLNCANRLKEVGK